MNVIAPNPLHDINAVPTIAPELERELEEAAELAGAVNLGDLIRRGIEGRQQARGLWIDGDQVCTVAAAAMGAVVMGLIPQKYAAQALD